jgi:hypothetical protein
MVPRPPVLLLLVVVVGCDTVALRTVSEGLEVPGEALVFEDTFLGYERELLLPVVNASRRARRVTLGVEAGPFLAPAELELGPWERREVSVRFSPAREGDSAGMLHVRAEGDEVRVRLQGVARTPPVCGTELACRSVRLDAGRGVCVEEKWPEGTACQAPCIEGGRCADGQCVGLEASCDDGDACTADACSERAGCLHTPIPLPPPPEDQPCVRAACDASEGLRWVSVEDGTPCGRRTCGESRVCISGACVARETPGGFCEQACGERPRCEEDACVTSQGNVAPVWRYARPPGKSILFPGLVDGSGNLYWFEYETDRPEADTCELVSVTRDGVPRYRRALGTRWCRTEGSIAALVLGEHLVLGLMGRAEWRQLSDGEVSWRPDLAAAFAPHRSTPEAPLTVYAVRSLAVGGSGTVYALVDAESLAGGGRTTLVALVPGSRQVKVLRRLDGSFAWGLLADEAENLYLSSDSSEGTRVESYASTGEVRWRGAPGYQPVAVWNGRVWTRTGIVLDAGTGARVFPANSTPGVGPVGVGERVFAWSSGEGCQGPGCPPSGSRRPAVVGVDGKTGQVMWHVPMVTAGSELVLTQGDRVLFTANSVQYGYDATVRSVDSAILEVSGSGMVTRYRWLCEPELILPPIALHQGRLFSTTVRMAPESGRWLYTGLGLQEIRGYDVPGLPTPASRGWTTLGGNMARSGSAR